VVNIDIAKYQGQTLFMPGYVDEMDSIGVKIVSVFPQNIDKGLPSVPATMVLVDGQTGQVCCMLDGTFLTRLRTGGAAGAATDILACSDAKVGAIFGTGGQAAPQVEGMLAARKLRQVRVFDIYPERAKEFAETMNRELAAYGAEIVPASTADAAVQDADVITAVTTSTKPVFNGRLIKEGAHINDVGGYTPQMQELDEFIIGRADRVFVESRDAVLAESGDFIIPLNKGLIDKNRINGELGQVIAGDIPGRTNNKEITIFKTVGTSVQD
jgi:ornithine cyclodeaminase